MGGFGPIVPVLVKGGGVAGGLSGVVQVARGLPGRVAFLEPFKLPDGMWKRPALGESGWRTEYLAIRPEAFGPQAEPDRSVGGNRGVINRGRVNSHPCLRVGEDVVENTRPLGSKARLPLLQTRIHPVCRVHHTGQDSG